MKKILSKKPLLISIMAIILVLSLVSGTIAWFIRVVEKNGFNAKTGDIIVNFNAYRFDKDNQTLNELASDPYTTINRDDEALQGTRGGEILVTGESTFDSLDKVDSYDANGAPVYAPVNYYIMIERGENSIDIAYTICFFLEKSTNETDDATAQPTGADEYLYAGGFSFSLTKLTSSMPAEPSNVTQEGLTDHEELLASYCINSADAATTSTFNSLATIQNTVPEGKISQENEVDYYRLQIRRNADTNNVANYAGRRIQLRAQLTASQTGAYTSKRHEVMTIAELDNAISTYAPGDVIVLLNNITYSKDLVFNRPVNLDLGGKMLHVHGNVVFSYNAKLPENASATSQESCVLDTTEGGQLIVSAFGTTGGNFTVDTPSSEFIFRGTGVDTLGKGDIYVQKNFVVGASYERGIVMESVRVYRTDDNGEVNKDYNDFKTIYLSHGTNFTVSSGTQVGMVEASTANVALLSVKNNGVIQNVNFANMIKDSTIVNMPQIYFYNNGKVSDMDNESKSIGLASWSKRFYENKIGQDDNGNTRVIQGYYGNTMRVSNTDPKHFVTGDIEVVTPSELVTKVNGDPTNLLVYYTNTSEKTYPSLKSILDHFLEKTSEGANVDLSRVETLTLHTSGDKVLRFTDATGDIDDDDYEYIRTTFTGLVTIDLANAATGDVVDYEVVLNNNATQTVRGTYAAFPNKALQGITNLKNVTLPENTQIIMPDDVLSKTKVEELYLPSNLMYFARKQTNASNNQWSSMGLSTVKYLHLTGTSHVVGGWYPQTGTWDYYTATNVGRVFVPESMVDAYRTSTYEYYNNNNWKYRFTAEAVRDSSGEYFLRQLSATEWEIAAYVGGKESDKIPAVPVCSASEPGILLNVVSIGEHAYAGLYTTGKSNLFFENTVRTVGFRAFYDCRVDTIDVTGLTAIDEYAFARISWDNTNSTLAAVYFDKIGEDGNVIENGKIESIGNCAFYAQRALTKITSNTVQTIGNNAFEMCDSVQEITLPALKTLGNYAFQYVYQTEVIQTPSLTRFGANAFGGKPRNDTGAGIKKLKLVIVGRIESGGSVTSNSDENVTINIVMNHSSAPESSDDKFVGTAIGTARVLINDDTLGYYETKAGANNPVGTGKYTPADLYLDNGVSVLNATNANFGDSRYIFAIDSKDETARLVSNFYTTLYGENGTKVYEIPKSITIDGTNYPVVELTDGSFRYNAFDATEVHIPETVTRIGKNVFNGRTTIQAINIPQAIEVIDGYAFYNVQFTPLVWNGEEYERTTALDLYGTTDLGEYAFYSNKVITSVTGNSVREVNQWAFGYCVGLVDVRFDSATRVHTSAFDMRNVTSALATVLLPSVERLDDLAFYNVTSFRFVVFGQVHTYGGYVLSGSYYTTVVNPTGDATSPINWTTGNKIGGVVVLPRKAAENTYGNSVGFNSRVIGEEYLYDDLYFENGTKVREATTATRGRFLLAVDRNAHTAQLLTSLDHVYTAADALPDYVEVDGVQYAVTRIAENAFYYHDAGFTTNGTLKLPEKLEYIGKYAFSNKTLKASIGEVVFPETLVSVGDYAFYGESVEGSVIIKSPSLEYIGENAFRETLVTGDVVVESEKLTTVGKCAFYKINVKKVSIRSSALEYFGNEAFRLSTATTVTLSGKGDGELGSYAFADSTAERITVEGFGTAGEQVFYQVKNLKELYVPDLHTCGPYFTWRSKSLTYLYAPNLVNTGESIVRGNTSLILAVVGKPNVVNYNYVNYDETKATALFFVNDDVPTKENTPSVTGKPGLYFIMSQKTHAEISTSYLTDNRILMGDAGENAAYNSVDDLYLVNASGLSVHASEITAETLQSAGASLVYKNDDANHTYEYLAHIGRTLYTDDALNFTLPTLTLDKTEYTAREIAESAFRYSNRITGKIVNFYCPDSLETIKPNAFNNNTALDIANLRLNHVKLVGANAFNSTPVTNVYADGDGNDGLTIESKAFYKIAALQSVHLGENAKVYVGAEAFFECKNLATLDFTKVYSVDDYSFQNDDKLTDLTGTHLPSIGVKTFYDCDSLRQIRLPEVTSVGNQAFNECNLVELVYVPKIEIVATDSFRFESPNTTTLKLVVFGELREVGSNAFHNGPASKGQLMILDTDGVTSETVNLTDSLVSAGAVVMSKAGAEGIYYGTNGNRFSSRKVPVENLSLDNLYFENGVALRDVTADTIGKYLYHVNLGANEATLVTSVENAVDLTANPLQNAISVSADGADEFSVVEIAANAFRYRSSLVHTGTLTLPTSLRVVGDYAFYNASVTYNLGDVVFPKTTTYIGDYAFYGESLTGGIDLEDCDELAYIGEYAFRDTAVTGDIVVTSEKLTTVGAYAFYGVKLDKKTGKSFYIESPALTTVGDSLFQNGEAASVTLYGADGGDATAGNNVFQNVQTPIIRMRGIGTVGTAAFHSADPLETFIAPDLHTIATSGVVTQTFGDDTKLTYVYMPDLVTWRANTFWNCPALQLIVLGKPSVYVENNTFNHVPATAVVVVNETATPKDSGSIAALGRRVVMDAQTNENVATTQIASATYRLVMGEGHGFADLRLSNGKALENATAADIVAGVALIALNGDGATYDYVTHILAALQADANGTFALPTVTIEGDLTNEGVQRTRTANEIIPRSFTLNTGSFTTFDCGSTITVIGNDAFVDRKTNLTFSTLLLHDATTIGENAFRNNTALTTVVWTGDPANAPLSVGKQAFNGCTAMTSASFGGNVNFGEQAFASCSGLQTVTVGGNAEVAYRGFYACSKLERFILEGAAATVSVGEDGFRGGSALVNFPFEKVTALGTSSFRSCASLTTVLLSDAITEIPAYAFYYTPSMQIFRAANVRSLGAYAMSQQEKDLTTRGFYYLPQAIIFGERALYNIDARLLVVGQPMQTGDQAINHHDASEVRATVLLNGEVSHDGTPSNASPINGSLRALVTDAMLAASAHTIGGRTISVGSRTLDTFYVNNGLHVSQITSLDGWDSLLSMNKDAGGNFDGTFDFITYLDSTVTAESYSPTETITTDDATYHLRGVAQYAFRYVTVTVDTLDLADTVVEIGDYAFYAAKAKKVVLAGANPVTIGDYAFYGCTTLAEFPFEQVTALGEYAFYNCDGIEHVLLEDSVTVLPRYAFHHCGNLISFRASGVREVADYALKACGSLQIAYLPECVVLGVDALRDNTALKLLVVGRLYSMGADCLSNGSGTALTVVFNSASAEGSTTLSGVSFGNRRTLLQEEIFDVYAGTTNYEIKIGNQHTVDSLYTYRVDGLGKTSVRHLSEVTSLSGDEGIIGLNGDGTYDYLAYAHNTVDTTGFELKTVMAGENEVVPRAINGYAFYHNVSGSLGAVSLPSSVEAIGDYAFGKSVNVTSLKAETTGDFAIGRSAFNSSPKLTTVEIKGRTSVGASAFSGCVLMTSFSFENVVAVEELAFYNCTSLAGAVNLSDEVTSIGANAFNNCDGITSLSGANVTSIGEQGIYHCAEIQVIDLPKLTRIEGKNAFANNPKLSYVRLGAIDYRYDATAFSNSCNAVGVNGLIIITGTPENAAQKPGTFNKSDRAVIMVDGDLMDYYGADNAGDRYLVLPKGVAATDLKTYGSHTVAGVEIPNYYYADTANGLQLVYCTLKTVTGEQLTADLERIATAESGKSLYSINRRCFAYTLIDGDVRMPDGLERIENRAFSSLEAELAAGYYSKIDTFDTNQVKYVGTSAFYAVEILNVILGENIETIEANAIAHQSGDKNKVVRDIQCVTLYAQRKITPGNNNFQSGTKLLVGQIVYSQYQGKKFSNIEAANISTFDSVYEPTTGEDGYGFVFYYLENGENCTITAIMLSTSVTLAEDTTLVIPDTIDGKNVTHLESSVFAGLVGNDKIKTVRLPKYLAADGFTYVGSKHIEGLTAYTVADGCENYVAIDGVLFTANASGAPEVLIAYPRGLTATVYELPNANVSVNLSAFVGNEYLQTWRTASA